MRGSFKEIIGKTIADVYCQENSRSPHGQIFLIFDDETFFEVYADGILKGANGLGSGNLEDIIKRHPKR